MFASVILHICRVILIFAVLFYIFIKGFYIIEISPLDIHITPNINNRNEQSHKKRRSGRLNLPFPFLFFILQYWNASYLEKPLPDVFDHHRLALV